VLTSNTILGYLGYCSVLLSVLPQSFGLQNHCRFEQTDVGHSPKIHHCQELAAHGGWVTPKTHST